MIVMLLSVWTALVYCERFESMIHEHALTSSAELLPDEELIAVAVIPLSMSLLRYLSINKDLGQYVLTSFGMMGDLRYKTQC